MAIFSEMRPGLKVALTRANAMDGYLEVHTGREIIDDIKAAMQDAFDLGFRAAGGSTPLKIVNADDLCHKGE